MIIAIISSLPDSSGHQYIVDVLTAIISIFDQLFPAVFLLNLANTW